MFEQNLFKDLESLLSFIVENGILDSRKRCECGGMKFLKIYKQKI